VSGELVIFEISLNIPLRFYTRARSGNKHILNGMVRFAHFKLTRRSNPHKFGTNDDDPPMLAALTTRLLLDFEPKRELSRKMESTLVQGNMRIAFSVPKHHEYLRSGSPSEPILAEAAAQEMYLMRHHGRPILQKLADFVGEGMINKGERGELVARFIFTEAYDRAVLKRRPFPLGEVAFSQAVPLYTFLEELFGKGHCDRIWQSKSDNDADAGNFGTTFEHAYVRFTHFVRDHEQNHVSTHTLWAALARGMAVQCSPYQDVIDIAIPVVMCEDLDEKLSEKNVTAILVQVKNTVKEERVDIDEAEIGKQRGFFPKDEAARRPYITIVMNLSVENKASKQALAVQTEAERTQLKQTPSQLTTKQRQPTRAKCNHPRFHIFVIGCSPSVYAVLGEEDRPRCAMLLGMRDLLDEHPRQTPESLSALAQMKPFWKAGSESYGWIKDEVLWQEDLPEVAAEDELIVGSELVVKQD
jgi:hypothetical protein